MIRRVSARVVSTVAACCTPPFRVSMFKGRGDPAPLSNGASGTDGTPVTTGPTAMARPSFDLDTPLITFNREGDGLSVRDVLSSVLLLGDVGSGKTSGPLFNFTAALHRVGASVVHTTVKPSDMPNVVRLAELCGRRDIRVFTIGRDQFNPIAWEQSRGGPGGGDGQRIENIVAQLALPMRRQHREGGGDAFWTTTAVQYLRFLAIIFVLARQRMSFKLIVDAMNTLPRDPDEVHDPAWRERCPAFVALLRAQELVSTPAEKKDLEAAAEWLLRTAPETPDRTRASTVATYCSAVDALVRGEIGETLNGNEDTWTPAEVVDASSVFVIDAPVQTFGVLGAIIQRQLLTAIQREVLRRDLTKSDHPIVIIADEAQEFADIDDGLFMRVSRERRGSMVLCSQCVANFRTAVSDCKDPKSVADMLMGLPALKLFAALTDAESLRFAAETFTQTRQARVSYGNSESPKSPGGAGPGGGGPGGGGTGKNTNISHEFAWEVPPSEIARLTRGGPASNWCVEVFISMSGRTWKASRRQSLKVVFKQILL